MPFPIPRDEEARTALLPKFQIDGTEPELEYDQITSLGSKLLSAPICLISILSKERQWLKSRHGIHISSTSREIAFCAYTVANDDPLVCLDASKDPRFRKSPLVVDDPHVRFYAGVSLTSAEGVRLGALCVADRQPRSSFDEQSLSILVSLGEIVSTKLQLRRDRRMAGHAEPKEPTFALDEGLVDTRRRARLICDSRRALDEMFGDSISKGVAFDILLSLYANEAVGTKVTVGQCAQWTRSPATTIIRHLERLVEQGLIVKSGDDADARKVLVSLSRDGEAKLASWLQPH